MSEECIFCGARFYAAADVEFHTKTEHGIDRLDLRPQGTSDSVCAQCGARFSDKEAFTRHALGPHYRTNRPSARRTSVMV